MFVHVGPPSTTLDRCVVFCGRDQRRIQDFLKRGAEVWGMRMLPQIFFEILDAFYANMGDYTMGIDMKMMHFS